MVSQFSVTVPTTSDVRNALDRATAEQYRNETVRRLSVLFGGATAVEGIGGYIARDGSLVTETVFVVSAFGERTFQTTAAVFEIAAWLAAELRQESVLVVVESKPYFVYADGSVTAL